MIPAAGLGTRFLPATKSSPKEMLPVVDRPAIQYVVEEAVGAGLTDILIITGRGKRAVEDHFDRNFELEHCLERDGKHELLKEVQFASDLADIHYVRQRDPLGLGHAVSVARHHVGDEPFAVLLADDLMVDDAALLRSMLDVHERTGGAVVALQEVSPGRDLVVRLRRAARAVRSTASSSCAHRREAAAREAPSNLAVIGRYVFPPEIFDALDRIEPGAAASCSSPTRSRCCSKTQPVFGAIVRSAAATTSAQKIDFLRANVELALDRPDLGPEFAEILRELVQRRGSRVIPLADAQAHDPRRGRAATRRVRTRSATRVGLVLAEAVVAREPVPPFANTGMDGYAVRAGRHRRRAGAVARRRRAGRRSGADASRSARAKRSAS